MQSSVTTGGVYNRTVRSLVLSLFLALVVAVPLHAAVPPLAGDWTKLVAGDYVIYSDASDVTVRDIATRLLTFRNALSLITRYKVQAPEPVTVFVFHNPTELQTYAHAVLGRNQDVGAITAHDSDGDGDVVLFNGNDWNPLIEHDIYHELTHTFTFRSSASLPLWFSEGVAEFYSTFELTGNHVRIGDPIMGYARWMNKKGLSRLADVLVADTTSPEYLGGTRTNDFYADSWLLVHYLLLGNPARGKAAPQFLTLLMAKQPPDRACQLAFGIPLTTLERELGRYLDQRSFSALRYTIDDPLKASVGMPVQVSEEEVTAAMGALLVRGKVSREDGKHLLEVALERKADRAETLAGLALAADSSKPGSGDAQFEKAVALGTGKAIVYRQYGRTLLQRQQAKRAREMYAKAVELNPAVADAHIGLGRTYLLLPGDPKPGIAELEKGLELDPQNSDAATDLVRLLVRSGDRDAANAVIDKHIAPFADAEVLRRARDLIEKK